MGRFSAILWRQIRHWERPAQIAFGLVLVLLIPILSMILWGPMALRQPALIGLIGLIIMGQVIFMWANRGMLTPYAQAQKLYLAEEFEAVCRLLENIRVSGQADVRALTLLGNAYRQRGLLDRSEQVLLEALNMNADHYFPLYGFGRTLLVQGRYADAASAIEQALEQGGPAVVGLDAAEAYFRNGQPAEARRLIEAALPVEDSYRQLMGQFLLYRLDAAGRPEYDVIVAGLPYWQAQAERYRDTPYGRALADDVRVMAILAEEA